MILSLRKFTILTALSITALAVNGQITISSTNMPSAGDTIRYSTVQLAPGVDFKTTGANKTWDFTGLKASSQAVYEYKSSTTTPYILNFGFSAIGLKIADSLGSGQMGLKNVYNFFKKSTAKWENVGIGFQLGALPLPQSGKHTNADEIYQFPLNYNDKDSSSFVLKVPLTAVIVNIGNYFQDGKRINTVDGWGKISTPYKNDMECIRIKSVITQKDSIAASIQGQQPINFAFPNNRVEYKWLSNTEKIPVLEVSGTEIGGNFTPTIIRYRDNVKAGTNVGINGIDKSLRVVYPNPANDQLNIEWSTLIPRDLKLFVFDMEGKLVESITYTLEDKTIKVNTTKLSSGKYVALLITDQGVYNEQFNILK